MCSFFFFNDTATTEIYTLSLHDALPISQVREAAGQPDIQLRWPDALVLVEVKKGSGVGATQVPRYRERSEEHTSELQSRQYLVCRLLLEKKKYIFLYNYLI